MTVDYVRHWFENHALTTATQTLRAASRKWIEEAAEARPGFADELRKVAMEALSDTNRQLASRGLIALSVVGTPSDLPSIEALGRGSDRVAADARFAAFEIKQRAV